MPSQYIKAKIDQDTDTVNIMFTGEFIGNDLGKPSEAVEINFNHFNEKAGYSSTFWHKQLDTVSRMCDQFKIETPTCQMGFTNSNELNISVPADLDPYFVACLARAISLMCRYQKESIIKIKDMKQEIKTLQDQIKQAQKNDSTQKMLIADKRDRKRIFLTGLAVGKNG